MSLKERIRQVYRRNCNSIPEFATKIGVSKSSVDKWLSGQTEPRTDKLKKISDEFGVDLVWLQTGISETNGQEISTVKCESCTEKGKEIKQLEARLKDKEEVIQALRDQLNMYRQQLDENADKSKLA